MTSERNAYHHGQLRSALIEAADSIIREAGIEGFSLREAARRARVSPGAPSHHFGNAKGLLTEVALRAYDELARYLNAGAPNPEELPAAALRRMAQSYVRFALDHPGHFRLMFRSDLVDRSDPRYKMASTAALSGLAVAGRNPLTVVQPGQPTDLEAVFTIWSTIHGMAHLVIEDKVGFLFEGRDLRGFVDEILPTLLLKHWPDSISG